MTAIRYVRPLVVAVALLWPAAAALPQAQPAQQEFEPKPYQVGKDVIWLPTPQELVDKMLDMAKVTPNDYVIDLGSGDGRTVITAAAKFGARAMGIEYNPDMVEYSARAAAKAGVAGKVKFVKADLFEADFSEATVVTMYLLPDINLRLRPKILDLRPGTRVVSHAFDMGTWKPDRTETLGGKTAFLWIVPAKVAGVWQLPQGELTLTQDLQMIEGTLKTGGNTIEITNARLRGDQIGFSAGGAEYSGRVGGSRIEGSVKTGGATSSWSATLRAGNPVSSPKSQY
jgi:SAM-dependent methyltransferase